MSLTLEDVLNKGIEKIESDMVKSIATKLCEEIITILTMYKSSPEEAIESIKLMVERINN